MDTSRINWRTVLIVGVLAMAVGFVLFLAVPTSASDFTGTANGTVSKVEESVSERRGRTSKSYRTQVTFEDANNRDVTVWQIVSGSSRRHHEGENVTVWYNPNDPQVGCLIVGDEYLLERNSAISVVIIAGGGIVCLVAAVHIVRMRRAQALAADAADVPFSRQEKVVMAAGTCVIVVAAMLFVRLTARTPTARVEDGGEAGAETVAALAESDSPRHVPHAELVAKKLGEELSGEFEGLGPEDVKGFLTVRNDSRDVITFNVVFTYLSDQGAELYDYADEATAVAPGNTVVLRAKLDIEMAAHISYRVSCDIPQHWMSTLGKSIKVKEVSHTDDTVTVEITNTGKAEAEVRRISCQATDAEGNVQMAEQSCGTIAPGESREKTFYSFNMYDRPTFVSWEDLEREYYISGYCRN